MSADRTGSAKVETHYHTYVPHPTRQTHAVCSICGFCIPRTALAYATEHGATFTDLIARKGK